MSLSANVKLTVSGSLSNTIDIGSAGYSFNKSFTQAFTNGTGADQANQIWTDERTISGSSNDDLDLYGSLTNAFGTTLNFTSIKGIFIKAGDSNGGNLTIGGEGSNPFSSIFSDPTDKLVLPPSSFVGICNPNANGYTVTASTGDMLRIANLDSASATYEILVIGEV